MRYTFAIEQAIRAASVLHQDQVRKGLIPYPYITHLIATAMIVSDYLDDEEAIVAALLHDTLSDTDYTEQEIIEDFGTEVHTIVTSIQEPKDKTKENQKVFFKKLKNAPEKALIVLAGEKIHNMRCIVEEYYDDPSRFVADFGTNLDLRLFYYQELSNALNRKLDNAILAEFNDVFTEYKNFLNHVQEKTETY